MFIHSVTRSSYWLIKWGSRAAARWSLKSLSITFSGCLSIWRTKYEIHHEKHPYVILPTQLNLMMKKNRKPKFWVLRAFAVKCSDFGKYRPYFSNQPIWLLKPFFFTGHKEIGDESVFCWWKIKFLARWVSLQENSTYRKTSNFVSKKGLSNGGFSWFRYHKFGITMLNIFDTFTESDGGLY